jgi:hypothetical protein
MDSRILVLGVTLSRQFLQVPADEPLGYHEGQGRGQKVWFHADIERARNAPGRVVRVKRRQKKPSNQGGLDCDFGRFFIADLSHHDDVGILAEQRLQAREKLDTCLMIDLGLVDPRNRVFDGFLNSRDVDNILALRSDPHQHRVERRGLARSGRPGDQHHPEWFHDISENNLIIVGHESQVLQVDDDTVFEKYLDEFGEQCSISIDP